MELWTKVWMAKDEHWKYTISIDCKTTSGKNVLVKFFHTPSLILVIPKKGDIEHVKNYFKGKRKYEPLIYEKTNLRNMWTGRKENVYELYFDSLSKVYNFNKEINNIPIQGLFYECHELPKNQQPISKFRSKNNIKTHSWITIDGKFNIDQSNKNYAVTIYCEEKQIRVLDKEDVPPLSILSIDGEMNASNIKAFPKAYEREDEMFKLGCVFDDGTGKRQYYDLTTIETAPWSITDANGTHDVEIKYFEDKHHSIECRELFVKDGKLWSEWGLPNVEEWELEELPDRIKHYSIHKFIILQDKSYKILYKGTDEFNSFTKTSYQKLINPAEKQLIKAFEQLIKDLNPDFILGHNIMGFDIPYIDTRKKEIFNDDWLDISRVGQDKTYIKHSSWQSSAYGLVHTTSFNCPERIVMDTLVVVRRLEKMTMYTLNHISEVLLGDKKEDMDYKDMFRIFRLCRHDKSSCDQLLNSLTFNKNYYDSNDKDMQQKDQEYERKRATGWDLDARRENLFYDKYEDTIHAYTRGSYKYIKDCLGYDTIYYSNEQLDDYNNFREVFISIMEDEREFKRLSMIKRYYFEYRVLKKVDLEKTSKGLLHLFSLKALLGEHDQYIMPWYGEKALQLYDEQKWKELFVYLYKTISSRSVSEYVVKDCILPIEIFNTMSIHIGYIALANLTNVEMFDTYTRGQGIRVRNQMYKKIRDQGYYFKEKNVEKEKYKGGQVEDPIQGLHTNVFVYDFQSLYPSLIRRYNLCFTTEIPIIKTVDEDQVHSFEWDREIIDDKGKSTGETVHEYHRFLKKENKEGVIPMMMSEGAIERSKLKKTMNKYKRIIELLK